MEKEEINMIEITKIYVDNKGAGRIYIPKEFVKKLSWRNKEKLLIHDSNSALIIKPAEEGTEK
jgi:bifunctional DNA-binding transcriptional regulator/antitoxin component of YhaV-PrlF toxin-antitoxin module